MPATRNNQGETRIWLRFATGQSVAGCDAIPCVARLGKEAIGSRPDPEPLFGPLGGVCVIGLSKQRLPRVRATKASPTSQAARMAGLRHFLRVSGGPGRICRGGFDVIEQRGFWAGSRICSAITGGVCVIGLSKQRLPRAFGLMERIRPRRKLRDGGPYGTSCGERRADGRIFVEAVVDVVEQRGFLGGFKDLLSDNPPRLGLQVDATCADIRASIFDIAPPREAPEKLFVSQSQKLLLPKGKARISRKRRITGLDHISHQRQRIQGHLRIGDRLARFDAFAWVVFCAIFPDDPI